MEEKYRGKENKIETYSTWKDVYIEYIEYIVLAEG